MEYWEARATYEDGYEIDKEFPYPLNNKSDNEHFEDKIAAGLWRIKE